MTFEIALVLIILVVAVFFLVTEWVPMEATALLVLSSLAITGLVSYSDALAGFSNSAVVTVWAVFILSGGLTQTGVANVIGRQVMRFSGKGESRLIILIMLSSGVMSAFMNNVAVAALLLPVIMDITRKTGHSPSRLLMPLAYGCLLGGLTTQIGTPPNILVSEALRDNDLIPFTMFDFTPIGLTIMAGGIAFLILVGRHLLPTRSMSGNMGQNKRDLSDQYDIKSNLFSLKISDHSVLAGKNLVQSRLGQVLGISVVGITRKGQSLLAPPPSTRLEPGDVLICGGREDQVQEILSWSRLRPTDSDEDILKMLSGQYQTARLSLTRESLLAGKSLLEFDLFHKHGLTIIGFMSDNGLEKTDLREQILTEEESILVIGDKQSFNSAEKDNNFLLTVLSDSDVQQIKDLKNHILVMNISDEAHLNEVSLKQSRLGSNLGIRVLLIRRGDGTVIKPTPETVLKPGDALIVVGSRGKVNILKGLEELEVTKESSQEVNALESEQVGLMEVMLSPHTTLVGKTLSQINFREKYGLTVMAIWRESKAVYSDIRNMPIRLGDAVLTYGSRDKLRMLGNEPDFLVLTESAQKPLRTEKLSTSVLLMAGVLFPVIMGWLPISISAVCGAALMVLTRCLTMEEAYRYIEWKAIFLIAGMMPLGVALDQTGAASLIAENIVAVVGPYGPRAVMFGMLVMTFAATCVIPTAALVVLMVPIILSASADMGISPYPMMMAMSMAASASFMTPISHPANVLVMGPGGYRFIDYIKLGLPLTIVVLVILMFFLPIIWPLEAV
ncbi:MAG: TRAP transporter large permease subunit [Desulfonatronovibrio sp. MSAO_Bac4]|nr:MAG: TRAP transporter large permease subunit [Desulfonatronovibrio sp. MSAO_Bac4]